MTAAERRLLLATTRSQIHLASVLELVCYDVGSPALARSMTRIIGILQQGREDVAREGGDVVAISAGGSR